MHDHLSRVLDQEVVGAIERTDDGLVDCGFGRLCLKTLSKEAVDDVVQQVKRKYPRTDVEDALYPKDAQQLLRGRVDLRIQSSTLLNPYVLQLTSRSVTTFYERRFSLEDGVVADLSGFFSGGLALIAQEHAALKMAVDFVNLRSSYLESLDRVLQTPDDVARAEAELERLLDPLRKAWRILPWPAKEGLSLVKTERWPTVDRSDGGAGCIVTGLVQCETGKLVASESVKWGNEGPDADRVAFAAQMFVSSDYSALFLGRGPSAEYYMDCFPGTKGPIGVVSAEAT